MNNEQRKALVHLLQTVMEISYKMGQQRSHYDVADEAKRLADVIEDDFLTDRATQVTEPDADRPYSLADMMREYQRGFRDSETINRQYQLEPDADADAGASAGIYDALFDYVGEHEIQIADKHVFGMAKAAVAACAKAKEQTQ